MSLARREKLVHLAREYDALIISDDVYDLLQWPVTTTTPLPLPLPTLTPLPLLSQIDRHLPPSPHNPPGKHFSHAISNASFSKLVGPGMRTGWVHGTADFAHGFAQTGTNKSGGAASQFAAAVAWRVLSTGALERHLDWVVRPALGRRHALVVGEVGRVLGGLGVRVWGGIALGGAGVGAADGAPEEGGEVFGGYFVWLTLPGGLDAAVVAERARVEEELVVAPGRLFEVAGDEDAARFPGNVRLSFSWADEEDIVEGVARLGRVLRRMLDGEDWTPKGMGIGEGTGEAEFK
jgi:DNA-binding transcriptional MocR family regulator